MIASGCFRALDLADNDAGLRRLSALYGTIRARDALGAGNAESASAAMARCRAVLDDFARRVDQAEAST
jgi:hypothetical protein